ncbi:hypothetical protein ADUPG1_011118, partial [Aduncisulcus paluster]
QHAGISSKDSLSDYSALSSGKLYGDETDWKPRRCGGGLGGTRRGKVLSVSEWKFQQRKASEESGYRSSGNPYHAPMPDKKTISRVLAPVNLTYTPQPDSMWVLSDRSYTLPVPYTDKSSKEKKEWESFIGGMKRGRSRYSSRDRGRPRERKGMGGRY